MKSTLLILLLLCTGFISLSAQSSAIRGTIMSDGNEPVTYATLMLMSGSDSTLVKAGYTNDDGNFEFGSLSHGIYFVKVTYVGYADYISEPVFLEENENKLLPTFQLETEATELQEVIVTAIKPLIEVDPDKTIFNIEGNVNAQGSDAMELLQKAPGVIVDNNDNVILQGKNGVRIFINGKPSPLRGEDLSNYLRSIQSEQVKSIELITNPSARYEAEGNGGIINILLKKDKRYGANGSVSSSYSVGDYSRYSNSANFNFRDEKINVFGNYGINLGNGWNFMELDRLQSGVSYIQRSDFTNDYTNQNAKLGLDYFIDDHQTVGIIAEGFLNKNVDDNKSLTRIFPFGANDFDQQLLAYNNGTATRDNLKFNLNYQFNQDDVSWNIDADYGQYTADIYNHQPNYYLDNNGGQLSESVFDNDILTNIDIITLKVDHEQALGSGKLGLGLKTSFVETDNGFDFYDLIDGSPVLNQERTNQFRYSENINAAYAMYNFKMNKWGLSAGLRLEHTHSIGELTSSQVTENENVTRDYVDLFPSGGITYQLNDKNQFRLNFSRRIDRPSYQDLNPFEFKLDELTFEKGNPFLSPQYTNSIQLSHTFNYRLNTTLGYSRTNDLITRITDTADVRASFITYVNLATQDVYSLNVSYPFSPVKWWSIYANAGVYHTSNEGNFGGSKIVDISATYFSVYNQHTFSIPGKMKLEVSGVYNSPGVWGGNFETSRYWFVDMGLQKKVFNEKISLRIGISDVFRSRAWWADNQLGDLRLSAHGRNDSRRFKVNMTYNFGNNQVKSARKRKTGLEDEQSRIKN